MGLHRAETRTSVDRRKRLEKKDEQETGRQLLPGIPNEISVDEIAAKFLTWRDICILSSVSRGWCQAVQSREVYNARLRLQTTENLPLGCRISFTSKTINEVSLHSTRNNYRYRLPLIPGFHRMPLIGCLHATLDGRIYILGGEREDICRKTEYCQFSNEVYVLDLAGQKQWKRCASMKQARGVFGGAVVDGKIYVFGGCQFIYPKNGNIIREPVCGSEVYDPQKDTWTSIKAMPDLRYLHRVTQVGPLLVMHGGYICRPQESGLRMTKATSMEAYHPGKDGWIDVSNEVLLRGRATLSGRTTLPGKTTTLGDPTTFVECIAVDGSHMGPRPYLSL